MITDFQVLPTHSTLADAVELILSGSQHDFPVVDGEQLVGILTRSDLFRALQRLSKETLVVDVMERALRTADAHEMLEEAFARLQVCDCHTLPVMRDNRLVGMMTMENVGEFLRVQAALDAVEKGVRFSHARAEND
jgi:CBS domain-containing protein